MTNNNISTILNNTIVPNALGESATIAEDLSDVSQLGVALANVTADQLKSYMKDFMLGVYYDWLGSKQFQEETYGQYVTQREFGGVMARLRTRMIPAMQSHVTTLVSLYANDSAPDYTDGHFYGIQTDQELFPEVCSFKLAHSWGVQYYKKCFMSAEGVERIYTEFQKCAEDSATYKLNELARANLRNLIASAYTGGRKVQLITAYNTLHGYTSEDDGYISLANWNLSAEFKLFCQETVIKLKKYVQDLNDKYNDGTIPNFSNEDDIRSVLLTDFATALDFNQSVVYHNELTSIGQHYTINFWQNQSNDLLPTIASGSTFDQIVIDGGTEADTTINHIVGVIYDRASALITERLNKITTKDVSEEDFITLFHHYEKQYICDTRESGIVLVLA